MARTLEGTTNWKAEADEWIRYRMHSRFTADDLITEIGLPMDYDPGTLSNNGIGAYLNHLAKRGVIRPLGYDTSSRASNHRRVLRQWLVIGRP